MPDDNKQNAQLIYESQESLYRKAVDTMNLDQLIISYKFKRENYEKAAEMFRQAGEYLDAPELEKKCQELLKRAEKDELEYHYQKALEQKQESRNAADYEKAQKQFRDLAEYKDSQQQEQECEDLKKKLQNRKRRNRITGLVIAAALLGWFSYYLLSGGGSALKQKLMETDEEANASEYLLETAQTGGTYEYIEL